ncbi:MAG: hypothetical protein LBQ68_04605 [Clostridiales bacterium]|jgi:hypothetical protein|nr:hypothetical protein [Clostridiales bacterium]
MKIKGLLILLLAVLLGVYADVNAGAVNNLTRLIAEQVAANPLEESFFAYLLIAYYNIPTWISTAGSALLRIGVCFMALVLKPNVFKQGGGFVLFKPMEIIGNGLIGYSVLSALILIFIVSVLGVPLAIMFLVVMWLLTLVGETCVGLAAGFLMFDSMSQKASVATYLAAGVFFIEILRCIPYLGYAVGIFLLPVFCVGVIITLVYEGFLRKNYLELPFWDEKRPSVRDIILKNIKER